MIDISPFKGRKHSKVKGSLIQEREKVQGLVAAEQAQGNRNTEF